jgi:hypothetical protein
MKTQPTHTQTPWHIYHTQVDHGTVIGTEYAIAIVCHDKGEMQQVNAAFIVRAVNSYQPMLDALKAAQRSFRALAKELKTEYWTQGDIDASALVDKTISQAEGR